MIVRQRQLEAKKAADYVNTATSERVMNCTADYPHCKEIGRWLWTTFLCPAENGYLSDIGVIMLARFLGFKDSVEVISESNTKIGDVDVSVKFGRIRRKP